MSSHAIAPTVVAPTSWASNAALIIGGTVILALSAQVSIPLPFTPVPLTGQTFGVLVVSGSLGMARGSASMLLYLLIGAAGAPVFADGSGGASILTSVTGGYLIGMLLASTLVGWAADHRWDRKWLGSLVAMVGGSLITYAVGATWLAGSLGLDAKTAWDLGIQPFLIGDGLKLLAASAALPVAWQWLDRVDHDRARP